MSHENATVYASRFKVIQGMDPAEARKIEDYRRRYATGAEGVQIVTYLGIGHQLWKGRDFSSFKDAYRELEDQVQTENEYELGLKFRLVPHHRQGTEVTIKDDMKGIDGTVEMQYTPLSDEEKAALQDIVNQ